MRRNPRRSWTAKVVEAPQVPNVDAVARNLSDDAKVLLLWLVEHAGTGEELTDAGLPVDRTKVAYVELEDNGLVRQIPTSGASIRIPNEVRAAILPPKYLTLMLGDVPQDATLALGWRTAAMAIDEYRDKWNITFKSHAMGGSDVKMFTNEQRVEAVAVWDQIRAFRAMKQQFLQASVLQ